jgi:hypothetical protein
MRLSALLLAALSLAWAPAPPPRPAIPRDLEAAWETAEESLRSAGRALRLFHESHSTQRKADLDKEWRLLRRTAAEQFTGLAEGLWRRRLNAAGKAKADLAAMKAAGSWCALAEYERAVRLCDRVAERSSIPSMRADALARAVSCRYALGEVGEARRLLLQLIRKERPRLAEKRNEWERWLEIAEWAVGR